MVERAVFRYIESELYGYDDTLRDLRELREEIIHGAPPKSPTRGTGASDSTGRKAIRLASSKVLARMERTVRAIDRVLQRLPETHLELYELKYRQGKPWQQVCQELSIARTTYFRIRQEIVMATAMELGFEVAA